mmetsp:Transcript_10655/g.33698  ORF Transcript_10655/g.33698 Transcript_10655/m.33698 type:complete len:314 (-) Transcript_10655:324-1265(-)
MLILGNGVLGLAGRLQACIHVPIGQLQLGGHDEALRLRACILEEGGDLPHGCDRFGEAVILRQLDGSRDVHGPRLLLLVGHLAHDLVRHAQGVVELPLGEVAVDHGAEATDLASLVAGIAEHGQRLHDQLLSLLKLLHGEVGVSNDPDECRCTNLLVTCDYLALQLLRCLCVRLSQMVTEDVLHHELLILLGPRVLEELLHLLEGRQGILQRPLLGLDVGRQIQSRGLSLLVPSLLEEREGILGHLGGIVHGLGQHSGVDARGHVVDGGHLLHMFGKHFRGSWPEAALEAQHGCLGAEHRCRDDLIAKVRLHE